MICLNHRKTKTPNTEGMNMKKVRETAKQKQDRLKLEYAITFGGGNAPRKTIPAWFEQYTRAKK